MKLWMISQSKNNGYDTYDSAVVAAETAEDARTIHPSGCGVVPLGNAESDEEFGDWTCMDNVEVELLGTAKEGTDRGVILGSYNAG